MTERLTDEQLQAIRQRQAAVKAAARKEWDAREALQQDTNAAEKYFALLNAEFEWEDARREAEAFAGEDIEGLLARIDALEMENAQLRDSMEVAVDLIGDIYSLAHRNVLSDLSGEGSIVDLARAASKCLLVRLLNEEEQ